MIALSAGTLLGGSALGAQNQSSEYQLEVELKDTFVYRDPDNLSPVLRSLYVGEIVTIVERIRDKNDKTWFKIRLGKVETGYISASRLTAVGHVPETRWKPNRIVRDERPMSFGLRVFGEMFGVALNFRYLPLTRLGFTLNVGAVLDDWKVRGTAWSGGLVVPVALTDITPILEAGITGIGYHEKDALLRIIAFYVTAGLEWMFDFGMYISAGVTYVRSIDVDWVIEWENARNENIEPGDYGSIGDALERNIFQVVRPSFNVGYGF